MSVKVHHVRQDNSSWTLCGRKTDTCLVGGASQVTCVRCKSTNGWAALHAVASWDEWSRKLSDQLLSKMRPLGLKLFCENCGKRIKVMAFQGTDYCSNDCRKELEKNNADTS